VVIVGLLWGLGSCGTPPSDESRDFETSDAALHALSDTVHPDCGFPSDPVTVIEDQGSVLKVWTLPLQEVHSRPVLPDAPELLAYRLAIRSEGADERYPMLDLPPARNEMEIQIWEDENFNNDLAYRGGIGSVEPISCLDALLFAEQNARFPQLDHPTEFLASVLRRKIGEREELMVIFGAGNEMFPPSSVNGSEIIDGYVAQGWRYWYLLHNHTRQPNGALGIPVPSTSDVRFARSLAQVRGLERVRVTNGFYTFDASVDEIAEFRAR
jgi:hypothetical protein